jgi:phosphatidylserine/phosphatidylglycerophosphate/cardiolipin synthase-like enzyme
LEQGVKVQVACGPGPREDEFVDRLLRAARRDGTEESLLVRRSPSDRERAMDHEKAIVADTWAVHGSMNLTYRGVELNGELVTVTTDSAHVASLATELLSLFT